MVGGCLSRRMRWSDVLCGGQAIGGEAEEEGPSRQMLMWSRPELMLAA